MNALLTASEWSNEVYRNRMLFTELFDGFIFFLAIIVISMILIFTIPRFRKNPSAKRRSVIKGLNIALTIVSAFFLLGKIDIISFLFNPYAYLTDGKNPIVYIEDPATRNAYVAMYILYAVVLIAGVIVNVIGYRTLCNKQLTQSAFRVNNVIAPQNPNFKACAVCGVVMSQYATTCPKCASEEFVSSVTQSVIQNDAQPTMTVCSSCNTANPGNAGFCHHCGNKLG